MALFGKAWKGSCLASVLRQGLTMTIGDIIKAYVKEAKEHSTSKDPVREATFYVKASLDLLDHLGLLLTDGDKVKFNVAYTQEHVSPAQKRAMELRPATLHFPGGGSMHLMPGHSYQLVYDEEMDILIKPLT